MESALDGRHSLRMEVRARGAVMLVRALPLRPRGTAAGALVLVRDITDLRRRDQALLSKDATIREIHHRVKNNLQTVASLLRLQARADDVDARKALDDSVNRILAIAAVHEVLTERRDDDVALDELLDRLRAMLVQGLGASKAVEASLEPVALAGNRATALALVFSELLQNALEHGGQSVRVELARRDSDVVLAIADDGSGVDGEPVSGTGLSIVRALVRDELGGTLALESNGGLRAEVVFPA
jgi:two-component sensor histidine kinase